MSKIYYVILSDGLPADVTTSWSGAVQKWRELGSKARHAEIVECLPRQLELPLADPNGSVLNFDDEAPTWVDGEPLKDEDMKEVYCAD